MTSPAFIFLNPTITIGPDPADAPGTALTVTCDLTAATVTNSPNMVDVGSLCGPAQMPGRIDYTLDLEGYQGYDVTNLWLFLWNKQRIQVPFTMVCKDAPVSPTNPQFTGECVCVPGQIGGTRDEAAVFTASLPVIGVPTMSTTLLFADEDTDLIDA